MIENYHIAAQERYNDRPYEPEHEPSISTGCKECGEWVASKTYHNGLCEDCRIDLERRFPTFRSSSVTPMTEYYVLTVDDRVFRRSAFDEPSLLRSLVYENQTPKRVLTWEAYEAEQLRIKQKEQVDAVRLMRARRERRDIS